MTEDNHLAALRIMGEKDRRIATLEKERDEYKRQWELGDPQNDALASDAGARLLVRLEAAEKVCDVLEDVFVSKVLIAPEGGLKNIHDALEAWRKLRKEERR